MPETILITGGSGFIGTHLIKALLARGARVVNFDLRPHSGPLAWLLGDQLEAVTFERGGVEDWATLADVVRRHKVVKIAHLASSIDTEHLSRRPKLAFDTMITGTVNALEVARLMEIQRFVFFSSIGVLPSKQYEPIDCNHPVLTPTEGPTVGAYGAAKISGEAMCWAYHKSCGLDFVILRPTAAYGFITRNTIYLPQFIEGALAGAPVHFDHGAAVPRDYTHVEDIAGIGAAALHVPAASLGQRCFYAASGMPLVTARQAAELVAELVPGAQLTIEPKLSYYDEIELPFRGVLDAKPVEKYLGYRFRYRDLRQGVLENIRTHAAWMRHQGLIPQPHQTS